MRTSLQHQFAQIPSANITRSIFNRSHGHKTTFDAGYLVPIFVDEVLPGDTFNLNLSAFARLSTPLFPLMDNMYLDYFFFFVPNRLLWSNWAKFMGEQTNPGDSIDYLIPKMTAFTPTEGSLADYFGLPLLSCTPAALPFRAYNLIYNEWFRDENLINSAPKNIGDGPDNSADYTLRRRAKRHDYFTSCLPWPQKGNTPVSLPLGTSAPVKAVDQVTALALRLPGETSPTRNMQVANASAVLSISGAVTTGLRAVTLENGLAGAPGGLYADLSTATAATINALRVAFQIQRLLERDARGGTRYTEIIRSHFGVVSPDARLQRSEFLGGGTTPLHINPVAQTSAVTGQPTPKGSLSAFGTSTARNIGFSKSFTEHGIIIGLVCARADLTYQQGLHKIWTRSTRYDFYWPSLANLGEQPVLNQEIYYQNNSTADLAVFGYQERWAEYRYFPSKITGKFRSTATTPLDAWHLSQKFTALPTLNQTFIEETPPVARALAVTTEPHILFDSLFTIRTIRPMPVYSTPGLIDHF